MSRKANLSATVFVHRDQFMFGRRAYKDLGVFLLYIRVPELHIFLSHDECHFETPIHRCIFFFLVSTAQSRAYFLDTFTVVEDKSISVLVYGRHC